MKTFSQKPADVTRVWHVVDASNINLGRLSTEVSKLLVGKHKPTYTPHTDGGDYVVVVNASKIALSGNKLADKKYYRHTGFPGGIKQVSAQELKDKDVAQMIEKAVKGMMPKNKLMDGRLERLKVYSGENHNHEAQKPKAFKIGVK